MTYHGIIFNSNGLTQEEIEKIKIDIDKKQKEFYKILEENRDIFERLKNK